MQPWCPGAHCPAWCPVKQQLLVVALNTYLRAGGYKAHPLFTGVTALKVLKAAQYAVWAW
jgi:hypothetical protein